VTVPQVNYDNLQIIHAERFTKENLTEFLRKDANRRKYAEHAKKVIREIMPVGARGMVVCKKLLVDHGLLPDGSIQPAQQQQTDNAFPWNFEGRHLLLPGGVGMASA
jgi:hypothetical protein